MSAPECCCPSWDGVVCVAIRYNLDIDDVEEPCECYCHVLAEKRFGWSDSSLDDWDEDLYLIGEPGDDCGGSNLAILDVEHVEHDC